MNQRDRWFGLELRHLAALAAISREGSFRRAAESLGYVQSAISQQIAQLEELVGVELIERGRGSKQIRVTPVGQLMVQHADEILARVYAARADVTSVSAGGSGGRLKVGVFPSVATGLLPAVLQEVAGREPGLRIESIETTSDASLFDLIERGELDMAFAELPLPEGNFESRTVLCEPYALLVAAESERADQAAPPTLQELGEIPLVMLNDCATGASLEHHLTTRGVTPTITQRTSSEATLRAFVAAGLGAAIVPRLAAEPWDPRVLAIDLDDVLPERQIALCWHSDRLYAGALQTFCQATGVTVHELDKRRAETSPMVELTAA